MSGWQVRQNTINALTNIHEPELLSLLEESTTEYKKMDGCFKSGGSLAAFIILYRDILMMLLETIERAF